MSEKKKTFEESMEELERGMKISKECKETLDNAEKKITILLNDEEKDFAPLEQE